VLDTRLADRPFVAGEYSIADMATFPWVYAIEQATDFSEWPHLTRWMTTLRERPAVQRGLAVLKDDRRTSGELTPEARSILFGEKQFARR
jgi:GST-like protein